MLNWQGDKPDDLALWVSVKDGLAVVIDNNSSEAAIAAHTSIIKPKYWGKLCMYLQPSRCRPVIALVGPAGNGKTTVAEAVLEVLGYEYEVLDMTEFIEPADLIGATTYVLKDGQGSEVYKPGIVTRCFTQGKALIINEFDAANPRAALCLQSAFQAAGMHKKGRYITSPEGRVYPQGDCPIILTMNTFGSGATRQYVGRNALDAASMDRITIITTGYEHEKEILLSNGYDEYTADQLVDWAASMRKTIDDNALRVVLSNRTLLRMADGIDFLGWDLEEAMEHEFLERLDADTRDMLAPKPAPVPAPSARPSFNNPKPASPFGSASPFAAKSGS